MSAGGTSATVEALRCQLRIEEYERLLAAERDRLRRFRLAGTAERRVAARLAPTSAWGWTLLADRRWPRTRAANVDLIHVGPAGVLVADVKAWAEPSVLDGRLHNGPEDMTGAVDALLAVTRLVEDEVADLGLAPLQVVPLLVFTGHRPHLPPRLGRARLLSERQLVTWVARRPERLDQEQVAALAARLADAFPPYDTNGASGPAAPDPPPPSAVTVLGPQRYPVAERDVPDERDELALLDVRELEQAMLAAAAAEPVETWMTWLHPEQVKLVRARRSGPARVGGPAGTGKTVVGLHRAAYLAATRPGRILYTSFVRTLPVVLQSLYARLSPSTADRVEFTGLHRWAFRLLRDRGIDPCCDVARSRSLLNLAWVRAGRDGPLAAVSADPGYWAEEIDHVIKGRGLTEFADYAQLVRVGRRTRLLAEHRAAVWQVYLDYQARLRSAGLRDLNDVLALAVQLVRDEPPRPGYSGVIVDEVQDLNLLGVQLLHALVGDRPDGLLLIGDGQQAVYPGGFTLAEAGIGVTGRSTVLRTNYRNGAAILDHAAGVVATEDFDDLDGVAEQGRRDVRTARPGGVVVRVEQPDGALHDLALVTAIRQHRDDLGVRPGDMAVLARSAWVAARYRRLLRAQGIEAVDLEDYDGRTSGAVKVGTVHRAKGLEFAHVYLPRLDSRPVDRLRGESDAAYRERVELAHRQLFVGMTRARDLLWLGYCASP